MTKVTRPISETALTVLLLAALSPLLAQGAVKFWDEVATARLEFPPHMISFAALCAGQDPPRLRILRTVCERHAQKARASAQLSVRMSDRAALDRPN